MRISAEVNRRVAGLRDAAGGWPSLQLCTEVLLQVAELEAAALESAKRETEDKRALRKATQLAESLEVRLQASEIALVGSSRRVLQLNLDAPAARDPAAARRTLGTLFDELDPLQCGEVPVSELQRVFGPSSQFKLQSNAADPTTDASPVSREDWIAAVLGETEGLAEQRWQNDWVSPISRSIAVAVRPDRYYQCVVNESVKYWARPEQVLQLLPGAVSQLCDRAQSCNWMVCSRPSAS